jgi:PAS domain S-box-containing protein
MGSVPDTQLFRDVFTASPIGIAVENLDGQLLFVNPAFCSMLGFSEEELRSKHCVDFSPREDAEKDEALFQQLRAGSIDHYQLEKRYFRRDGSLIWGRLSVSLLENTPPLIVAMVDDITEKKTAEEARFRHVAIVESSEDAIISKNLDAVIVSWNAGAQRIFGYTEEEAVGQPITLLIPPELRDEENMILVRLRGGGRIEHYETVRVTKAGKRVDVSLSISSVKDSTGRIVGFTKIAHDITERKRAEDAVKESEQRFRLIADTAPVMIWMSGTDKLCTYFNKPWLDFTGRSLEEELGNGWAEGVHADDLQNCLDTYTQLFERREKFRMQYRLRRYDGEYCWILDVGVPRLNPDRSFAGYIGIAVDVTERKEAEEALREFNRALEKQTVELQAREELLKIFVKNVPAGVAMLDRDMRYLQVSDRWCADYSVLDSSQVLGRSHYELFPDIPDRWKEVHRRALAGETVRADEDRWDREGGTTWLRWEVRPWLNLEGLPGGILIFAEDITRRKQMEEVLSDMSRKLIESQEQERARIGRELHDDINQRLAMLAMELDQLQGDPSDIQSRVRRLREQTLEISSDVQALSHDLHSSKLEYLGVVGGIKSWCKEFAARQRMEIDFKDDVSSVLPFEVGLCLLRVLQEALHNSVKHSGVKRIEVQLAEKSNEVQLTVCDLGTGFDTEAAKQHGGLGLKSMRERVRLVNGTIEIRSKPMRGTTVCVRVPFKSERAVLRAAG